ncbi:MAG: hypothetical protein PHP99_04515 [Paludibacter sp.]|nr:hypothetical protein [Paludibacter sp.]
MKNTVILISLMWITQSLSAQNALIKYMSKLPPLPENFCNTESPAYSTYTDQITKVIAAIDEDVERLEQQTPTQNQVLNDISKKTGISTQKLNELINTEDEGEAEKLMQQQVQKQYGVSLSEFENVANMSKDEQEKWGKEYSKTDKSKQTVQKAKSDYQSADEINKLNTEITAYINEWSAMLTDLQKHRRLSKAECDTCIEKVRKNAPEPKYQSEHCINQNAIDEFIEKNEAECYKNYCNYMTPKIKAYLNRKKTDLPKVYELMARKYKLENDLAKSQTGVDMNNMVSPDIIALGLIRDFANEMMNTP